MMTQGNESDNFLSGLLLGGALGAMGALLTSLGKSFVGVRGLKVIVGEPLLFLAVRPSSIIAQ